MSGPELGLVVAVFLACTVEAVEALTVVLAVGVTRSWSSALAGAGAAITVLAALVLAFGTALTSLPLGVLRVVIGGLLLVIGLQWLRKAILRASGFKAFHDEAVAFAQESEAAGRAARARSSFDSYSFTIAFRGVLLEGVEVVFIVLTFGANQHRIPLAALAAAGAVALVVLVGVAVRKPLARVPENAMKFAVGVMLTSFGMFWSAEGAGASWPGSDAALLALIPGLLAAALAAVALMRRRVGSQSTATKPSAADGDDAADISVLLRIARGVWSFVVGDDWRIALGIVAVLAVVAVFAASEITAWWVLPLGVIVLLADSLRRAASPLARIR